jgi:hypothetical protein
VGNARRPAFTHDSTAMLAHELRRAGGGPTVGTARAVTIWVVNT